jgi:hypothetical protein
MIEQYRYENGHTYLMRVKILAKIEELQPVRQDPEDFPARAVAACLSGSSCITVDAGPLP